MKERMKHPRGMVSHAKVIMAIMLAASLLAGCATTVAKKQEAVFFPPAPNAPRVQFLKSISGSDDVEDSKSGFSLVLREQLEEKSPMPIIKPYGVKYFKGKLYVCDVQAVKVAIIDLVNKKFEYLKGAVGYGKLKKPINLTVDNAGNLYVVDTVIKEVLMYDASGSYVKNYGKGIVKKPVDVAVEGTELYILDLGEGDIKVLDRKSGDFVRSIGKTEGTTEGLSMPTNFVFDDKGFLYATNISSANVIKLDKDGHILSSFGKLGDAFGEFTRPKGIAVDTQGRIYVVDGGAQNVQIFNDKARLLMFFGDPPLPVGALNLPASIDVTAENLDYFQKLADPGFVVEEVIFVTNQSGPAKVSIYGLGHRKETGSPR